MNKRVLLADNDLDFLEGRAEMLEGAGYKVLKAASREQAESILNNYWLHAAIIDVRLRDDNDSKDVTGLALAKMKVFQKIPKIILTRWPNYQAVREALSHHLDDLPPAVDFLDKREGPKAMIEALERVFQHHLRINWNLVIQTNQHYPLAPAQIVNLIEPGASSERLAGYAEEFEDLLRRLFYGEERITIDRLLWHREGRLALSVFVFARDKAPDAELVVCGSSSAIEDEARRCADYAPQAQASGNTLFDRCVSTTHFGANAYTLTGYDLENPVFLIDVVNNGSERDLTTSIQLLFESTLKAWQQQKRIVDPSMTTAEWYQARVNGNKALVKQTHFEKALKVIAEQTIALGLEIKYTREKLTFDFGLRQIEHSNPTGAIYESAYSDESAVLLNTPGKLSAENLLVDSRSRIWLTDFGDTGFAPPAWNFIEVEAAARFDWLETTELDWLYEMEKVLLADDFTRLNINDVEPPLRRYVKSIKVVRRNAIKFLRQNFRSYQLGILYQAAARIANFDPAFQLMPGQVARLAHCVMAAAMIADRICVVAADRGTEGKMKGVRLNKSDKVAYVDGVPISIKGRGFRLLLGFYENAGQLCTRRQIIEQFLAENYDEKDQSQVNRLNTAIFRLRERIEEDPYHPRFLITEPGGGYRFLTHPEDH
jgi:DNA-binding response OmpR family regulator